MAKAKGEAVPARPTPPADLGLNSFTPAPEVAEWIRRNYIEPTGPLFTQEHVHLEYATIGVLWASYLNVKQMRRIIGQAELPQPRGNAWAKGRAEQQLNEWFGEIPDFVLTFDADYVRDCADIAFCALVDHELCHCAQAVDEFGAPKFSQDGRPKFAMRGHDIEEFVSVVRRFGIESAGKSAVDFVKAAQSAPEIGAVDIAKACGTCCG
jgi:hypothetical protein